MEYKSEFLRVLQTRGYLHQCTEAAALDELMALRPITAYIGFDCTARSLHIGSLMQIMVMRYLQKFGHKVVVLLGGGTTKIGDPSGKDKARAMLSEAEIAANKAGILATIEKFLHRDNGVIVVDNAEWLGEVRYLEFLREIGSKFSVNAMLGLDSVRSRLDRDQSLSFLEFSYVLLQSYDFVELHRRHKCVLQIGGADQWGNIVNGIDLGRKLGLPQLYGLTTHLLLTSTGEKMGKTAYGAVWLDAAMFDPGNYWQYFRNVPDVEVGRLLRLFTELPMNEIAELENLQGEAINEAKKVLATEATAICHGKSAALAAENAALQVFEHNDDVGLPNFPLHKSLIAQGISVAKLLQLAGLEESISAGRRLIKGRGCKINGMVVEDADHALTQADFARNGGYITVFCGKKRRIKVVAQD
ncbi:tyrosyl-tRNA synthetase [Anaplasma centrale str. Israel]|uniref:Tyrosine--tRNA ligase n=1 Tax=Anaplasma centrale (strain Israel) TaxID=574556 RepID=D1ATJ8_ANACI|nr:tyrosine--tRNA ligase [Anaplasma centrale]ACZ48876.1 tyrosyl-tRNA synthetase [Anaplasma centrale str. Israel]